MTKNEFISALKEKLTPLGADAENYLQYYSEMIDDRIEEGLTEEEAVAALGSPVEAADQILQEAEIPQNTQTVPNAKEGKPRWVRNLLICTAIVWGPIAFSLLFVFFVLFAVLWSLVIAFFAASASVVVAGGVLFIPASVFLTSGTLAMAVFYMGVALLMMGVGIFGLCGSVAFCRLAGSVTTKLFSGKHWKKTKEVAA